MGQQRLMTEVKVDFEPEGDIAKNAEQIANAVMLAARQARITAGKDQTIVGLEIEVGDTFMAGAGQVIGSRATITVTTRLD